MTKWLMIVSRLANEHRSETKPRSLIGIRNPCGGFVAGLGMDLDPVNLDGLVLLRQVNTDDAERAGGRNLDGDLLPVSAAQGE